MNKGYFPNIVIADTHAEMAKKAAHEIAHLLQKKPHAVLGLPTGSTPIPMYKELVRLHVEKGLDFSQATFLNLDEYIGLPKSHSQSYHYYMQQHLFRHVNAKAKNIHIPSGTARNIEKECAKYEDKIRALGGIDLQIVGIGTNGHIGFCEPGVSLNIATHKATLAQRTRKDNARFFDGDISQVPTHAISMGLGTVRKAKKIILMANGQKKSRAIYEMLMHPISTSMPASALRLHHKVTILLDKAAAQSLEKALKPKKKNGAAERNRTSDPVITNDVLYH